MADLLAVIVAATRCTLDSRREREPLSALERRAAGRRRSSTRFAEAISRADAINVIAECKRRSPSKGVLRPLYDAVAIAREYQRAGAAAISVLTEPAFFDGSLEDLAAIREAVDRPLLRKDFIVDEYQLFEAIAAGTDAVLLIVAALEPPILMHLIARARSLDLDVLVEVHTGEELQRALDAGATIVGVNNRNLRTLSVDVAVSDALAAAIPRNVIAVAESGIRSADDVRRLQGLGYKAFLIGEQLMTQPNPGAALAELIRQCASHEDCVTRRDG